MAEKRKKSPSQKEFPVRLYANALGTEYMYTSNTHKHTTLANSVRAKV